MANVLLYTYLNFLKTAVLTSHSPVSYLLMKVVLDAGYQSQEATAASSSVLGNPSLHRARVV